VNTARDVIATSLEDCTCYPGGFNPSSYEGPQEDCSAHGRPSLQADAILSALAAAGFVIIRPTDPEVIERVAEAIDQNYDEDGYLPSYSRSCVTSAAARAVLAALGGDQ
jgi:DUF1680 family protein